MVSRKHFYGTKAFNAFAEGAAGVGQCKCMENAFGEVYRGYCLFVVVRYIMLILSL